MTIDNEIPSGPLTGVRVLEVATVIMAPLAGRQLAKLGAEVVKVEPVSGDVIRKSGQSRANGQTGTSLNVNDGKRSVALSFSSPEDLDLLKHLIEECDILITNQLPRRREKYGLDWPAVSKINPRCILVTGQGFATESEYANVPAYDDTIQAASGVCDVYQLSTGIPKYAPYIMADKVVGLTMTYAAIAALYRREITGVGQWVDVPMFDTMVDFNMIEQLSDFAFDPPAGDPGWPRTVNPHRRPHATADGWICIIPYSDQNWRDFLVLAGKQPQGETEAVYLSTNKERNAHVEEMQNIIAEYASERTTAQIEVELSEFNIPVQRVNTLEDLVSNEYLNQRNTVEHVERPDVGKYWRTSPNMHFSESPLSPPRTSSATNDDKQSIINELVD